MIGKYEARIAAYLYAEEIFAIKFIFTVVKTLYHRCVMKYFANFLKCLKIFA